MADNAQNKGVVEVRKGKLQYKLEKEGAGAVIEPHFTPLIRYSGRFLNGKAFGTSREDERLCLDESVPALKDVIPGRKEGDKITIWATSDESFQEFCSGSAVVLEVEIIKANRSCQEKYRCPLFCL